VRLIACLMFEKSIGEVSRWAPYIATLPEEEAGVPLLWQEDEADRLLAGTELAAHRGWRLRQLQQEWRDWIEPLTAQQVAPNLESAVL
jgi:hypothetical protein